MFSLIAPLALGYLVIRTITGPTIGAEERGYLDTGSIAPNLSRSFVGLTAVATVMMAMGAGLLERRDILH